MVTTTLKTVKDLFNARQNNNLKLEGGISSIMGSNCYTINIGETSSYLNKSLFENRNYRSQYQPSKYISCLANENDHNFFLLKSKKVF